MPEMKKILSSLINFVKFWRVKEVPGVADQIRKTQLGQEQKARKTDMQELLRMVQEGRLHEADERQLEYLKLALELNEFFGEKNTAPAGGIDSEQLVAAVKQAIAEGMSGVTIHTTNIVKGSGGTSEEEALNSSRPQMKHTSLADLAQDDTKVDISHKNSVGTEIEGKESSDKLKRLKELKGVK